MTTVVDPGLFTSLDPPRLAGSRCRSCGTVTFPVGGSCPRCTLPGPDTVALPDAGTVWTWTVQTFPPKPPYVPPAGGFSPYAVGYVDLGDVLVESHLLGEPGHLRIGLPVRLVLTPVGDGSRSTFAFEATP